MTNIENIYLLLLGILFGAIILSHMFSLFFKTASSRKWYCNVLELIWVCSGLIGLFLATPYIIQTGATKLKNLEAPIFINTLNTLQTYSDRMVGKHCIDENVPSVSCAKFKELRDKTKLITLSTSANDFQYLLREYSNLNEPEQGLTGALRNIEELESLSSQLVIQRDLTNNLKEVVLKLGGIQILWPLFLGFAFGVKIWRTLAVFKI